MCKNRFCCGGTSSENNKVFRLSTTIAANAGCYAQIYVHCCLEMTKQLDNELRQVLQAPPHLYGALCVFTYSSWSCFYEKQLQFHLQQMVTVCLISRKPLKGCFKQTLKELAAAQDCADICSTRISHSCASSSRLVPVEGFHRAAHIWSGMKWLTDLKLYMNSF